MSISINQILIFSSLNNQNHVKLDHLLHSISIRLMMNEREDRKSFSFLHFFAYPIDWHVPKISEIHKKKSAVKQKSKEINFIRD